MATLAALISALDVIASQQTQAIAALEEKAAAANHGLKPTYDRQGKAHAPCAGYIFNDCIYNAGEYMSDNFARQGCTNSAKVLAVASLDLPAGYGLSKGKAFERDGQLLCYVYVANLTISEVKSIEAQYPTSGGRELLTVVEALEKGVQLGKTWKVKKVEVGYYYKQGDVITD